MEAALLSRVCLAYGTGKSTGDAHATARGGYFCFRRQAPGDVKMLFRLLKYFSRNSDSIRTPSRSAPFKKRSAWNVSIRERQKINQNKRRNGIRIFFNFFRFDKKIYSDSLKLTLNQEYTGKGWLTLNTCRWQIKHTLTNEICFTDHHIFVR